MIDSCSIVTSVQHCVFSMRFDNIHQCKDLVVAMLLLLMAVASDANPLSRCGENEFFDLVARICTNCEEVCDPRRGTEYLCEQYADECTPRE